MYRWELDCFFEQVRRRIAASAAAATLRATGDVRRGFPGGGVEKAQRMQRRPIRRNPFKCMNSKGIPFKRTKLKGPLSKIKTYRESPRINRQFVAPSRTGVAARIQ